MKQADGDAWSAYMARLLTYYCRTSEKTSKADSKVGKLFQLQDIVKFKLHKTFFSIADCVAFRSTAWRDITLRFK